MSPQSRQYLKEVKISTALDLDVKSVKTQYWLSLDLVDISPIFASSLSRTEVCKLLLVTVGTAGNNKTHETYTSRNQDF